MVRRAILIVFIVALVAALVYSYFAFRKIQHPVSDALRAVPANVALLVEGNDLPTTWSRIAEGNIMWEALKGAESFAELDQEIGDLFSLYTNTPEIQEMLNGQPLYIATCLTGATSYHHLVVYSLPQSVNIKSVEKLLAGPRKGTINQPRNYDGATIHTIGSGDEVFTYTILEGVFIGSYSPILVEDAIRQFKAGGGLPEDPWFNRVRETAGAHNPMNIFVNHKNLPDLTGIFLNNTAQDQIKPLARFSQWTELDVKIKSNYLMMNGFSLSPDSLNQYLSLFSEQKPQEMDAARVISSRTATVIHFGFSNYKGFRNRYTAYLEKTNQLTTYKAFVDEAQQTYGRDVEEDLLSWLEYELALYVLEPVTPEFDQQVYALLRTRDPGAAKSHLNELAAAIAEQKGEEPLLIEYLGHEMRQIALPGLFKNLFGSLFGKVEGNYYTFLDRYVLFANTPAALRDAIVDFENQRTLDKDINYAEFSESLSSESNLYVYSNIARSPFLYQAYTSEETTADMQEQLDLFRQFEAVAYQVSKERDGMYYNNLFLKYNPVYKQETKSLWERQLDSVIWTKPQLMTNHYTQMKEVLVQDQTNMLYLITNTGKLLWKKQLDEPIMGEVKQVDVFANKKLQLLFNTRSRLYCIDRNGEFLEGFPAELSSPASAPLSAIDYDRNSKYRILIPGEGGVIMNYDKKGQAVEGWKFDRAGANIKQPLQLVTQGSKDYVVAVDSLGGVYILNRKGKNRITIRERLPLAQNSRFFVEKGSSLKQTYLVGTDQGGNVIRINFEDELENVSLTACRPDHFFFYTDLNNDGTRDYILADSNKIMAFEKDKSLLFEHTFATNVTHPIQVFFHKEGVKEIGVVTGGSSEIFMLTSSGIVRDKFPLYGSTGIAVGDIDQDGSLNLVTGHSDKSIYTYSLDY